MQAESDLLYIDRPKDQNFGVCYLCMCPKDEQKPTHDSNATSVWYWCKRCGLYLLNTDMDVYYGSELFKAESDRRKQLREESLIAQQ